MGIARNHFLEESNVRICLAVAQRTCPYLPHFSTKSGREGQVFIATGKVYIQGRNVRVVFETIIELVKR